MQGNEAAVGFYWTMPVPWAGFTDVPKHVDAAAAVSLTIRYQRDLIRRYAKSHRMDLIHEAAFVEVAPDRGTEQLPKTMCKVETICQDNRATRGSTERARKRSLSISHACKVNTRCFTSLARTSIPSASVSSGVKMTE